MFAPVSPALFQDNGVRTTENRAERRVEPDLLKALVP